MDGDTSTVPAAVLVTLALSLAGAGVAAYLTWVHYDLSMLVCGVGDCHTVQASPYATIGPIPIALLGLGMFLTVAALAVVRWRAPVLSWPATFAAFMLSFCGVLYFVYLTYLEVAIIGAICQWCVLAAGLTFGVFIAEIANLRKELRGTASEP
jgi:uncharacterized membrane protein